MKSNHFNHSAKKYLAFIFAVCFFLPHIADAVTVGPVKLEYAVDPGSVISGELYIKNEESAAKTFYPSVDQFTEQNGEKAFLKEQGRVGEWFRTEEAVSLEADESKKVPFTITIPNDAPPGGHFGVVWFSSVPPTGEEGSQVSIQTRAGILVYINVSGDITEAAKITLFDTEESQTFFSTPSVPFNLTVSNDGNVYIKPKGSLKITSIFGRTVREMPLNNKGLQILPGSYRTFGDLVWEGSAFTFGLYKAEATVMYGSDKEMTESRWVWVFPLRTIAITLGSIIIISLLLSVFFKHYNQWLIKKYAKRRKE